MNGLVDRVTVSASAHVRRESPTFAVSFYEAAILAAKTIWSQSSRRVSARRRRRKTVAARIGPALPADPGRTFLMTSSQRTSPLSGDRSPEVLSEFARHLPKNTALSHPRRSAG